jgi:hypothetical protein
MIDLLLFPHLCFVYESVTNELCEIVFFLFNQSPKYRDPNAVDGLDSLNFGGKDESLKEMRALVLFKHFTQHVATVFVLYCIL